MRKTIVCLLLLFTLSSTLNAQITDRKLPANWENLVEGASFINRFLPMPDLGGMTTNTWGAACVIPRDINNGIEEAEWSYWGGQHTFNGRWKIPFDGLPLGREFAKGAYGMV